MEAEGGFGFFELLMNYTTKDQLLIGGTQRVRGEVDATLSQLGKVGFVGAGSQEFVGILGGQPDREAS